MLLSLSVLGLLAPLAMCHLVARDEVSRCGTPGPTDEYLASLKHLNAQKVAFKASGESPSILAAGLTVDMYIHVVARSQSPEDGYLTPQQLDDQIAVIRNAYAPGGITFNIIGTQYIVNEEWVDRSDDAPADMKRALHVGDYRTLNLYFLKKEPATRLYGRCSMPNADVNITLPDRVLLDGCVVRPETVPGGSQPFVNGGKTAVHEIGHWFGLWHTFESHGRVGVNPPDGCVGIGDEVADTPAAKFETWEQECPETKDTCRDLPGLDPVHNYMDYSRDDCLIEFTPGQVERMFMIWQNYRANA